MFSDFEFNEQALSYAQALSYVQAIRNAQVPAPANPLIQIVQNRDVASAAWLLEEVPELLQCSNSRLLSDAILGADLQMVNLLLKYGARVDVPYLFNPEITICQYCETLVDRDGSITYIKTVIEQAAYTQLTQRNEDANFLSLLESFGVEKPPEWTPLMGLKSRLLPKFKPSYKTIDFIL